MRKAVLILPILLILSVAVFTYYKLHKPSDKYADIEQDRRVTSTQLFNEFQLVENTANNKYRYRVIEVTGKVKEIRTDVDGNVSIILEGGNPTFGINCRLAKSEIPFAAQVQKEEEVTLRGICKGILMDVVLEDCVIE